MSAASAFINFLVADMEATGSTAFASDLLSKAKAQITAGNGSIGFMTTGSMNGKTFGRQKEMSALEVAAACREALDFYADNEAAVITFPDFGRTFIQP